MIIFGTTGIKTTIKEGQFHCPQCHSQKNYRHRKINKFFTLYFIPIIPLGSAGEFVECRSCKGTFVPRVLEYSQAMERQARQQRQARPAARQEQAMPSLSQLSRSYAQAQRQA